MNIFNLELPEENENDKKFPKLDSWFNMMNDQFKKIEEINNNCKINNILIDNDIEMLD